MVLDRCSVQDAGFLAGLQRSGEYGEAADGVAPCRYEVFLLLSIEPKSLVQGGSLAQAPIPKLKNGPQR